MRPSTLYVFSFFAIAVLAAYLGLAKRRLRRVSASWPKVGALFESGSVIPKNAGSNVGGTVFLLETRYSYSVLGSEYQGSYDEEFRTPYEAEQTRRSLEQGPLLVRYNPAAPEDYFMDPYRDVRETRLANGLE